MIPRIWLSGTLLSVAAVLWMGWRLLEQDRKLEVQQQRQGLESAAEAAAAVLEKSVLQAEQSMMDASWGPKSGEGAVVVRARDAQLESVPGGILLFSPIAVEANTGTRLFEEAERKEFSGTDLPAAEARYRELVGSADANIRAGALVRLARVKAKRGETRAADEIYAQLARLTDARFEAVPAPLVAYLARGAGRELGAELDNPKLLPSEEAFLFHAEEAVKLTQGQWKPRGPRLRLSQAVAEHWPVADGAGRAVYECEDGPITILWRRDGGKVTVLASTPDYVNGHWTARAEAVAAQAGARLRIGRAAAGVTRGTAVTGLPWPISLERAPSGDPSLFSGRRRLIAVGTFAISCMLLLAGYFTQRAVNREIAAARMQSEFVAAVSHEFRTPLTALRQFTDMLLERSTLSEAQRRTCYEAQARSTERLSRLVESLLDFRRMEAGARPYVMEMLDAGELMGRVAEEFRRESGAEVRVPEQRGIMMQADAGALSLALWNLLDNAAKYAAGAPIDLSVRRDNGGVRISVADRGPGIAPSDQRRIFERFVRGSNVEGAGVKGMGIGLAMVKHIAEAHRGRVELESTLGAGSRFTLVLPATES